MRSYQSILHQRHAFFKVNGLFRNFVRARRANPFSRRDLTVAGARERRDQRRRYILALLRSRYIMFYSTFLRLRRPHMEKTRRAARRSEVKHLLETIDRAMAILNTLSLSSIIWICLNPSCYFFRTSCYITAAKTRAPRFVDIGWLSLIHARFRFCARRRE